MLYDPKWEQPKRKQRNWLSRWWRPVTPAEVFEMTDFIAWVSVQPPEKRYDFTDSVGCALGQYLGERGVNEWGRIGCNIDKLHPRLMAALNTGGSRANYSFGPLRDRLLAG